MADTVRVRPRHGLILDGIPPKGADIPRELADEWLADRLVFRVEQTPTPKPKPVTRRSPRGSGASRPRKQRRT